MAITGGLITLEQARAAVYGSGVVPQTDDAELEFYVEAATPVIERIAGPQFLGSRTFTFDGGSDRLVIPVRFGAVTSVVEDGVTVTDYVSEPQAGLLWGGVVGSPRSWAAGIQNVVVTVTVGSATVPKNVQLATRELVRHWWQQGRQGGRPAFAVDAPADPSMVFGVPTRRLGELLAASPDLPGFA